MNNNLESKLDQMSQLVKDVKSAEKMASSAMNIALAFESSIKNLQQYMSELKLKYKGLDTAYTALQNKCSKHDCYSRRDKHDCYSRRDNHDCYSRRDKHDCYSRRDKHDCYSRRDKHDCYSRRDQHDCYSRRDNHDCYSRRDKHDCYSRRDQHDCYSRRDNHDCYSRRDKHDCYSRRDNLVLRGVLKDKDDDAVKCVKVARKFFVEHLTIPENVANAMIFVRCHRLGTSKNANGHVNKKRPIIVRFHHFQRVESTFSAERYAILYY